MKFQGTILWIVALLLAAGGIAYWRAQDRAPQPAPVAAEEPEVQEARRPARERPQFPIEPPVVTRNEPQELTPLPPLTESDAYFELEITELFGNGLAELLADTALIEKIVATVDNLPREQVAEKVRPLEPLMGTFLVDGQDGSGAFSLNVSNYERYEFLVNLLATSDVEELANSYRRFYPLFQEAYMNLGYPDGHFNDRLVTVINHLLDTPDPNEPIELVRPHVLYEFADPEIESLSSGQKLLIRAGSEHRVRIKQFLEEFRDAITGAQPPA